MRTTRSMMATWLALPILLATAFAPTLALAAKSAEEKRAQIREESKDALEKLYALSPSAREDIERSAGYATFRNMGIRIGVAGGGRGGGLVFDRTNSKEIFMRFLEIQAGVGGGIKKYDLIFVFEDDKALQNFINKGWEYGGQASAAAMVRGQGKAYSGAVSVSPGVWLYQITSGGLAAEVTLKGSKYFKDSKLN